MGTCAPTLIVLTNQVNVLNPNRDKASDGCCASATHTGQNPTSDHEPARTGPARGYCRAKDIDEDILIPNYSMAQLLKDLTTDPRSKYIIYERRLYHRAEGWRPKIYTGVNPHDKHLHLSIYDWAVFDRRAWPIGPRTPAFTEEEMITNDQVNQILDNQSKIRAKLDRMGGDNYRIKRRLGLPDKPPNDDFEHEVIVPLADEITTRLG